MNERLSDEEIKEYLKDLTIESGKREDRDGRSLAVRREEAEKAEESNKKPARRENPLD